MGRINKSYLKQLAERKKFESGGLSTEGYRRDSPDVDNPYNVIPSNYISMDDVDFPIYAVSNAGDEDILYPGEERVFSGDYVTEFPLKNMGNKRYGQQGFNWKTYKDVGIQTQPSKNQIVNARGQQREYTNVPVQKTPAEAKAIKEKQLAELKRKTEGTIRETTDADREAQNRQALTFSGAAEKRGASSPLNTMLDAVNPFSYYYSGKDALRGVGQTAQGIYNLDPNQIGSGLTQASLGVLSAIPAVSEFKPALKQAGKYLTQGPLRNAFKQLPGSSNKFKSEIDWAKWNPDTPKYPELINEYNAIEQSTKKAGTWMKNPDGSAFQGTPEQFIQQQSSYFKKAFGDSKLVNPDGSPSILYHGSRKKFNTFDESQFGTKTDGGWYGKGIYTSPDKHVAKSYSLRNENLFDFRNRGKVYELYVNSKNPGYVYKNNVRVIPREMARDFNKGINDDIDKFNYDLLDVKEPGFSHEVVIPFKNNPKSAVGNVGFFDMTNPNIYKGVLPYALPLGAGLGTSYMMQNQKPKGTYQEGGTNIDLKLPQFGEDKPRPFFEITGARTGPQYDMFGYGYIPLGKNLGISADLMRWKEGDWRGGGYGISGNINIPINRGERKTRPNVKEPVMFQVGGGKDKSRRLLDMLPNYIPIVNDALDIKDILEGAYRGNTTQVNQGVIGLAAPGIAGKGMGEMVDYFTEKTLGRQVADQNQVKRDAIINMNPADLKKLYIKYGPGGYDKWVKAGKPNLKMGGTMGIPGVNGQVVSSGPQPLSSVRRTRGPINKTKKGDVKTMSSKQVKQTLKYSKQKPNKI